MTSEDNTTEATDAESAAAESATAESALAAAQDRIAQLSDQMLRIQAEADNVRKRAQRDVENAHKFALERFAGDLLAVVDNLERAVDSTRAQGNDASVVAIVEGIELSLKLFLETLKRAGIERLDPVGEPFNPQFHQAVGMVESPHAEPGSVVNVLQKGYTLNGRLLRAAMVMVAKAPAAS